MTQKVKPTPALVLFVLLSRTVVSVEFAYNGFNEVEVSNLSVNGGCSNSKNGVLQLTNETSRVVGHVFYKNPIKFKNDKFSNNVSFFSTGFAFGVVPEYAKLGGHGFAFTISRSKEMKGALLVDFEFGDISDIHVGIDINDLESNSSVNASYFSEGNFTKQNLFLQCGKTIQAWIDYDSSRNLLNVTLSICIGILVLMRVMINFSCSLSPDNVDGVDMTLIAELLQGVDVPLPKTLEETHKKKKPDGTREEWVEPRAKDTYEGFQKSIEDWRQTQPSSEDGTMVQPSPVDMTRIWTTMVGGPKKGKTYGLGVSQSSSYSSPMLPNSASISQNAEEIEVMRTKIEELPQHCAISDAKFVKFEALVKKHMPQVFEDGEDSESDD
ncbi:putative thaumatin-like protein-like [Capsicum annuum]|nr:putative thaumatin-like protein-like [Capsicum annuum]